MLVCFDLQVPFGVYFSTSRKPYYGGLHLMYGEGEGFADGTRQGRGWPLRFFVAPLQLPYCK
jgi:hypothetical protein